jgi:2-dehydropantoate 2-reductase
MARILIFGTGSIGAVYGFLLQKAGAEVTCVCRSTYDTAKRHGLRIESTIFGTHTFRSNIVKSVSDAVAQKKTSEVFDFIVVCTKAISNTNTPLSPPSLIQAAVSAGITSIVVIQNGLGVERVYREAFPTNTIISGVTYMPVSQIKPGVFSHTETQMLHLGVYQAKGATALDHRNTESFADLLKSAGAEVKVHQDVQIERWTKLVGNATWNPICALCRCRDLEFLEASPALAEDFIVESMREVVSVAAASGYGNHISEGAIKMQLARSKARKWPGVEPSMMADMLSGKPMEIEGIVGEVVEIAKNKGVSVPRLETLYLLLRGYDWHIRRQAPCDQSETEQA